MTDFSHLRALEISSDDTAEFVVYQVTVNGVSPTLVLRPATEANKPYFNAMLKRAGRNANQVRANQVNVDMLDDSRKDNRHVYSRHVIRGWSGVTDADGNEVAFSQEACAEFLRQLPDWLFDEIHAFASNPVNFTEALDVDTVAKN